MAKRGDTRNSSSSGPGDPTRQQPREASEKDDVQTQAGLERARAAVEQAGAAQQADDGLVNSSVERLKTLLDRVEDALGSRGRPLSSSLLVGCPTGCELGPYTGLSRKLEAFLHRLDPAVTQLLKPLPAHPCNGDEAEYQTTGNPFYDTFLTSFGKGLPHNNNGEVDPASYCAMLRALNSGIPYPFGSSVPAPPAATRNDFENIPLGCSVPSAARKLENPQAAYAYELEGADSHQLVMPPAPKFNSVDAAAEMAELYWMALARDVPFTGYVTDPLIAAAGADLAGVFPNQFTIAGTYNAHHVKVTVTPSTLFRGFTAGDRIGPYISQFMLMDVPYGAQFIPARIRTLLPSVDYLTGYNAWLEVQRGCDASQSALDSMPRFIRNGRDLAQFVHVDRDFNAFLNACLILLSGRDPPRRGEARPGFAVPFAPGLPYVNPTTPPAEEFPAANPPPLPPPGRSTNQIGLGTFGDQHIKSVLVGALSRAFHAVWYQKWCVHRRLRPEEFAGRVHLNQTGVSVYPIAAVLFNSALFAGSLVLNHNRAQNAALTAPTDVLGQPTTDTYLLPMAYAEGCPLHPSYGSGHSTVAGCLATLLKAFFADKPIMSPVVPNPEGTALISYTGPGATALTVHGELNKLASNVGIGRIFAGVHWRTDHTEALRLGEQVAIEILRDQRNLYNEPYQFAFNDFDGSPVAI